MIQQPVMVYEVSPQRFRRPFHDRSGAPLPAMAAASAHTDRLHYPDVGPQDKEGVVALKIARVHYARAATWTSRRASWRWPRAAPKRRSDAWRCLRYRLKINSRRRFSTPRIRLQSAL